MGVGSAVLAFRLLDDMVERLASRFRSFDGGATDEELSSDAGSGSLAFRLLESDDITTVLSCSLLLGMVVMVVGTGHCLVNGSVTGNRGKTSHSLE